MRKIRMIRTTKGSPDGVQVFQYVAGQVYLVPPDLADLFVREGWAEEDKTLDGIIETKDAVVKEPAVKAKPKVKTRRK